MTRAARLTMTVAFCAVLAGVGLIVFHASHAQEGPATPCDVRVAVVERSRQKAEIDFAQLYTETVALRTKIAALEKLAMSKTAPPAPTESTPPTLAPTPPAPKTP